MSNPKLFFITGVSTGFGRAFAQGALDAGYRVVGTLRKPADVAPFEALAPGRATGIILDVTDTPAIAPAVARIEAEIGPIDVLVNNAGYGHEGVIEETGIEEVRRQFEVNVYGPVALIQAVLPFMRARRSGHIINITSMGGLMTLPGLGIYHGSKFALEGISESLGKEVKDLGIHVTAVEPGSFRTDWAGRSMVRVERAIADYDSVFEPWRERRQGYSGKQPGNPAKAAQVLLELVAAENPPAHLLLGSDAVKLVGEKLAALEAEFAQWRAVSVSTDFDPADNAAA
ncbi:oxidoreductase [Ancylobacter sp. A5.8]|uniref:oxidoreductase n=1 Tax=Ancylobacter gelatini TaxID=2919920 RepID=UPI001F4E6BC3|nr:oxidoreductase [Ancylobacter gelatini]MCJ8142224.1 oxidoreductase [Ancylobacter gelatini]